ncbi:hypothetical protein M3Y96_00631100 [Aphelenchoides besseyi]|nr:hypothetical protein M3Y96_00631100 [Aphelenchoides besseyi]
MSIEVHLSAVTDTERFKIIDLYRERPVLWSRKVSPGTREAVSNAWIQIAASISSPDRQFAVELVQKITKNLRDQYIRLQRRSHKTSWKFYSALSKDTTKTNQLETENYLSLAVLSDLRCPPPTTNMVFDTNLLMTVGYLNPLEVAYGLLKTYASTKQLFSLDHLDVVQNQLSTSASHSNVKQTDSNKHESTSIEVELKDVHDTDRFKLIELYRQKPILWSRINETRKDTAKAWAEIVEGVSTSTRRFSLGLVQKLIKNMRDQYIRNLRRRTSCSWKFYSSLSFLKTTVAPPLPRCNGSPKECDRWTSSRKRSASFSIDIKETQSKKKSLNDKTEELNFDSFKQPDRESCKNAAFQSIANLLLSNS